MSSKVLGFVESFNKYVDGFNRYLGTRPSDAQARSVGIAAAFHAHTVAPEHLETKLKGR